MELIWTKVMAYNNFGHYYYQCKPFVHGNTLYYAYYSIDMEYTSPEGNYGDSITVLEIDLNHHSTATKSMGFKNTLPKNKKILQSKSWHFVLRDNTVYLYVGFLLSFTQTDICIADSAYNHPEFAVKSKYYFADKYLVYNQRSTLVCFDAVTHEKKWTATIKGFLYTDIELVNNCLLFGTAGKGGAFYCIDLLTGHILTEHINGDASSYAWQNSSVILKDKKGNIQEIDPFKATVLQTLILNDKLFYAPILVDKQYIYTTAYNKKSNSAQLICLRNSRLNEYFQK